MHVTYETRSAPRTKRIAELRFAIRPNAHGKMVLSLGRPAQLKELYDTLVKDFGLGKEHIDEIVSNEHSAGRINAAIEFTRYRMRNGSVKAPGLYLMAAIRDGLSLPETERDGVLKQAAAAQSQAELAARRDDRLARQAADANADARSGYETFVALPDAQRAALVQQFLKSPACRLARTKLKLKLADLTEDAFDSNETLRTALGHFVYFRKSESGSSRLTA